MPLNRERALAVMVEHCLDAFLPGTPIFHPNRSLRGCDLSGAPEASTLTKLCATRNVGCIIWERQ